MNFCRTNLCSNILMNLLSVGRSTEIRRSMDPTIRMKMCVHKIVCFKIWFWSDWSLYHQNVSHTLNVNFKSKCQIANRHNMQCHSVVPGYMHKKLKQQHHLRESIINSWIVNNKWVVFSDDKRLQIIAYKQNFQSQYWLETTLSLIIYLNSVQITGTDI